MQQSQSASASISTSELTSAFARYLQSNLMPPEIADQLDSLYLPLAQFVASLHQDKPVVLGINGAQGSGKSTISAILVWLVTTIYNKRVLVLSIDDLYLPKAQRIELANTIHPLLATRGVPGTHDVELGIRILQRIKAGQISAVAPLMVPRFDKSIDDRAAEAEWQLLTQAVDLVIFEGWCVGSQAQSANELTTPVNTLEREHDANGNWVQWVNQQLATRYRALFEPIDYLLMLKAPSFAQVYQWRHKQEQRLKQIKGPDAGMSDNELSRFIEHYQRLTQANLANLPKQADLTLDLNEQQQIISQIDIKRLSSRVRSHSIK